MDTVVSSTPDTSWVTLVAAIIRAILQIASGFGFAWALTVSGSQTELIASAIVMGVTGAWSLWQKIQAARHAHDSAVVSAARAIPVQPASRPA